MELIDQITAEAEAMRSENEPQMDAAHTEIAENEVVGTSESADPEDETEEEDAEEGASENPDED